MRYITTLTRKGQMTIPRDIRKKFHLKSPTRVILEVIAENTLKFQSPPDIIELAGTFRPRKMKPVMGVREAMEKNYKRV